MSPKILLVVDEAHHLLKDIKEHYKFIQTVLENSKDFDLSVNLITQNPNDFNKNVRTRKILQKCPIKLLFKMDEEIDKGISSTLKIKENHMDYLNNSYPGSKERGYSEALLGVEEDYIPITIKSNEDEERILALENTETWRDIKKNIN